MFAVRFALAAGVNQDEFTREPAMTILKHGEVSMDAQIRINMSARESIDVRDFVDRPEKLVDTVFSHEIKTTLSKDSPCSTCAKFCLGNINPHRVYVERDIATMDEIVNVEGAKIICVKPCTPSIDHDVAGIIHRRMIMRGELDLLPMSNIRSIVELELNTLRNEMLFGGFGDHISHVADSSARESTHYSRPAPPSMEALSLKNPMASRIMDYIERSVSIGRDKFLVKDFLENVTKNNGVPKTAVESVW